MLVVLPFCNSDAEAVVRNLKWAIDLDTNVRHDCLLSYATGTEAGDVRELAIKYFATVLSDHVYSPWNGPQQWPQPQNWAFQTTAKHIRNVVHRKFFWLEPDAVLVKSGALDAIETEWEASKKPMMGCIVRPGGHMNGVGCYPWDFAARSVNAMLCRQAPWDVVMRADTIAATHDASHLIQRYLDTSRSGFSFTSKEEIERNIASGIVVFHGCRDDTLIRWLQESHNGKPKPQLAKPASVEVERKTVDVGVVITTHNRPQRCQRALETCIAAGFPHIVITATGDWKPKFPIPKSVTVVSSTWNPNSNAGWLAGIKASKAERILILHDDDMVLPEYLESVRKHLEATFLCYTAKFHRTSDTPSFLCVNPRCHEGELPSDVIREYVMANDGFSITPVRGLFKKEDLIEWLTEAGKELPTECYYRKGFLVGNDLWIWLRASHKYKTYYSLATPLVSLGCDSDSTSVTAMRTEETKGQLRNIYNIARGTFSKVLASNANSVTVPSQSTKATSPSVIARFKSVVPSGRTFYHSGDLGDILYCLPTVIAMGGGGFVLGPASVGMVFGIREQMTRDRFAIIAPLLAAQPYIASVTYSSKIPAYIDLQQMRRWHYPPIADPSLNLADRASLWYTNKRNLWKEKWLHCTPNPVARFVFNRTLRWHGNLDWKLAVSQYGRDAIFIGLPPEYKAFCESFGDVRYHPTANLMEVATVIAGAEAFFGNQSVCYAIAEGLKVTSVVEVSSESKDCQFPRPNRFESVGVYADKSARGHAAGH